MTSVPNQLINDLNDAQERAVVHSGGHLLIVAGPGTGKTHTLTQRIIHLISKLQPNEKILAITFTNKAAQEMRERLIARMNDVEQCVTVGTFHSFCLQILRQYITSTNLPENFRVAAPDEIEEYLKSVWDFPTKEFKVILENISQWKSFGRVKSKPARIKEYNELLRSKGLVDFDDLLHEVLILLRNNEKVAGEIKKTYRFICVDEYQDLNAIQNAFLKELLVRSQQDAAVLTAIGDPNQAIYSFRGSDVQFFHQFDRDFPGATIRMLSDNYRSAKNLLEASGQVIGAGKGGELALAAIAHMHADGRLIIHEAPTDKAEAEYVVHQIENVVGGTSMFSHDSGRVNKTHAVERSFGDIAVLYRLNAQKNILKTALERSGIPYQVCGDKPLSMSVEHMNLIRSLAGEKKDVTSILKNFETSPDGQSLLEKDKELTGQWPRFLRLAAGCSSLDQFFDKIALEQPEDIFEFNVEKVSLMTLHAAKGLEFPVVFIVGCEEHLLPLDFVGMTSDVDEERRLFYVGMTRAKEQLHLSRATHRQLFGQVLNNPPSRFIADINEDLKAYEKHLAKRRETKKSDDEQMTLF